MEKVKELQSVSKNEIKPINGGLKPYNIVVYAIGIFLARAMPIYGLAPFGVSFLTTQRRFSVRSAICFMIVCLGYASLLNLEIALKYIFASISYMAFLFIADRGDEDVSPLASVSAAGVSVALGCLCQMIWTGFSSGEVLRLFCDVALTTVSGYAFNKTRIFLNGKRSSLFSMNSEEKLCLVVIGAIALSGFKNISIQGFFYSANVVGIWITVVFALCGGGGVGALCGVAVGMVLGFNENLIEYVSLFSVCGALCGGVSRLGKTVTIIGMCISVTTVSLYIGMRQELIGYLDIPLSVLAVLMTSEPFIRNVGRMSGIRKESLDAERNKEYIKSRLYTAADSFRTLAETFFDLSDKESHVDTEDISMMFDRTADRVCRECPRLSECWVNNFNGTYKSLFHLLEVLEQKGEISETDADEYFLKKCMRLRSITKEMNRLFEIYKINCVWKSKLTENRILAGEQMGSVSHILDNIAEELCEERIDLSAEEEIRERIEAKGYDILGIFVTTNLSGRYNAYIEIKSKQEIDDCRRVAETAIRGVLGEKLVLSGVIETNRESRMLRFSEPEGYRVEAGIASTSAGSENGDNCITRYLSGGKYVAALSDGMGTGHKAARDSGATVRLLGDFLEAGFDKGISVRLVNSIMVMKSASEAFATVDMCVIDLFSGEAEFIKNGAEPSYIKRREGVETVRAVSLPVGVVQNVTIESFAYNIKNNDVIVLMSDGLQGKREGEDWIRRIIEDGEENMPSGELADRILDMAKTLNGEDADDMTVVVLKLQSRN